MQAPTMNMHQLYAEQYKISLLQYEEAVKRVDQHYEAEMKAEAESFERLKLEFEAKMDRLTKFKEDQTAALKQQYAISDS